MNPGRFTTEHAEPTETKTEEEEDFTTEHTEITERKTEKKSRSSRRRRRVCRILCSHFESGS